MTLQKASGTPLTRLIVDNQYATEEAYLRALATAMDVPYQRVGDTPLDSDVLAALPARAVYQYGVIPVELGPGMVRVATSDPFKPGMVDGPTSRRRPRSSTASAPTPRPDDGRTTASRCRRGRPPGKAGPQRSRPGGVGRQVRQPDHLGGLQGPRDGHPSRADGEWTCASATGSTACCTRPRCRPSSSASSPPSSPASRSWPTWTSPRSGCRRTAASACASSGEEIDVRVSTMPTVYGESVSLRLLMRSSGMLGLDRLGLEARDEGACCSS
jgi:hypothetical protein